MANRMISLRSLGKVDGRKRIGGSTEKRSNHLDSRVLTTDHIFCRKFIRLALPLLSHTCIPLQLSVNMSARHTAAYVLSDCMHCTVK